ncbi:probable serine/threonine-protein kinase DDB_G0277165 [Trichoplusia ni]|uniref:Probable serine/threonine-protein kinase DDB_G0277165 n=1 Tax=Trichoplusia ni TaxID=7111 RepID=A0A7E5VUC7_TRINI|nr:probable serine/threonine-protein kinase DDB_G0277165 [Trichoplusia ni]
MSFLTILFFASAFYVTHGWHGFINSWNFPPIRGVPDLNPRDVIELSTYQEQTNKFLEDVGTAIDTHIKPLLSHVSEEKQEELKTMGLNEVASYIDFITEATLPFFGSSNGDNNNNQQQLPFQPLFRVLGNHANRVSRAFNELLGNNDSNSAGSNSESNSSLNPGSSNHNNNSASN